MRRNDWRRARDRFVASSFAMKRHASIMTEAVPFRAARGAARVNMRIELRRLKLSCALIDRRAATKEMADASGHFEWYNWKISIFSYDVTS